MDGRSGGRLDEMRNDTEQKRNGQESERTLRYTKASLRGGLDLTSILGRVHSRRRRREESVPSAGARARLPPGAAYTVRISVLVSRRFTTYTSSQFAVNAIMGTHMRRTEAKLSDLVCPL